MSTAATPDSEQQKLAQTAARLMYGMEEPDISDWLQRGSREVAGEERILVDGELRGATSGKTFENLNPATGEVIGRVADGGAEDVTLAIAAARRAFDEGSWAANREFRARCLRQLEAAMVDAKEELRAATVAEVGCTVTSTYAFQVEAAIAQVGYCATMAEGDFDFEPRLEDSIWHPGARRQIVKDPVGVVGSISPWNFPIFIVLNKIAPALAAGCTVIHKPAQTTPYAGTLVARLIAEETEFPPGVVNIVAAADPQAGEALSIDPRVDLVHFTGSTATGRRLMKNASETVKKVCLELGGKSANLVLEDADMEQVIPRAAGVVCFNAGQACALPTRLLVPHSRYDEVLATAQAVLESVPYGDPFDPAVAMGPVNSERQLDRVLGYIESGNTEGARILTGGRRAPQLESGWFVEPTLLADVTPEMAVFQEEIFGPVLTVTPYDGEDEAAALANDSIYGLSGVVWSGDEDHAVRVAKRLRTGTISINGTNPFGLDAPFGGYAQSGIGREWGEQGFEEFLETKLIACPPAG